MRIRACVVVGAVASALSLGAWFNAQAQGPALPRPKPQVQPLKKLANPAGTAKAVAALARFANGQLGASSYDQRVARALGKLPGAQQTAKRVVEALEKMPLAERTKAFPGVSKVDQLTTSPFDRAVQVGLYEQFRDQLSQANTTVLPPDPYDPKGKAAFELVYRGAQCNQAADGDGSDEIVTYFNVIAASGQSTAKFLPDAGTAPASPGALTTTGAGQVWSNTVWPGGWNTGIVIVTAVLEDNGDLAQRKQEIELLVQFGLSEAEEDNVTPDRAEVIRRELEDALALLHLANPDRWSAKAVAVKKLTSAEYDDLYLKPSTPTPAPYKLSFDHDPRGGSYTLLFDIPPPSITLKTVFLRVKELEALGPDRDFRENKIADLGVNVSMYGNTGADASKTFAANKNLVTSTWSVERDFASDRTVSFTVRAFDVDPAPECACSSGSNGWGYSTCYTYCAAEAQKDSCKNVLQAYQSYPPTYVGPCAKSQSQYDLHPLPNSGTGWFSTEYEKLNFTYDLATHKLAGDIQGAPGTFTVVGTDGAGNKARIVLEVGTK